MSALPAWPFGVPAKLAPITVHAGAAIVEILPQLGASITEFTVGNKPVLRPWSGQLEDGAFAMAHNLLVPFANRIADGFAWDGNYYALDANRADIRYPIHGDAYCRNWQVVSCETDRAVLELNPGSFGPWHYHAVLTVQLSPHDFAMQLAVTNLSNTNLPYGLGFHPWFPRSQATRLEFNATRVWLSGDDDLPSGNAAVVIPNKWQFAKAKALPATKIDNAFVGWERSAKIYQGSDAVSIEITASALLTYAHVFSPSKVAKFFCFEPVSHPPNAHNMTTVPGLVPLDQGETITGQMQFSWK